MTPDLDNRAVKRIEYWNQKHQVPHWDDDIHFGLLGKDDAALTLSDAVRLNTQQVCHEIMEMASVYQLSVGLRVLDFACGKGDLMIEAGRIIPNLAGVGIDISQFAIDKATARNQNTRVQFSRGGIDRMEEVAAGIITDSDKYDVILCRDAYYTLTTSEQERWWGCANRLLRRSGVIYLADLAVHFQQVEALRPSLIDRQYAGEPITWDSRHGERIFSVVESASKHGFEPVGFPDEREEAVPRSYRAAAASAPRTIATAYQAIATLAEQQVGNGRAITYVRLFFAKALASSRISPPPSDGNTGNYASTLKPTTPSITVSANAQEEVGLNVAKELQLSGKTILKRGEWVFPKGKWSLIVGRSGVGKSTVLKLLSGVESFTGVEVINAQRLHTHLLRQPPDLLGEVSIQTNIALFSRHDKNLSSLYSDLGLDSKTLSRKADTSLSSGERQRAALCVALAAEPELLLLDEPCAMVDRVRKMYFFSKLKNALTANASQQTLICVEHEFLEIREFFAAVFEMAHGRIYRVQ